MRYGVGPINEVRKYLEGLDFPAEKWEVLEHIRLNDAPAQVMAVANRLPDKTFEDARDVMTELLPIHQ